MKPILIVAPAIEPVSLVEAKAWLRLDGSDEDDLVQALIVSARLTLEAYTRRFFVTQSWRLTVDAWPSSARDRASATIAIPLAPFQSVAAIRVFDAGGVAQLLPAATYRAPPANDCARIVFSSSPPAPGRQFDGIEIDIVVGYGVLALNTPESLRRAMLTLVSHWHEHRGDGRADEAALPAAVAALAKPFRRERLI